MKRAGVTRQSSETTSNESVGTRDALSRTPPPYGVDYLDRAAAQGLDLGSAVGYPVQRMLPGQRSTGASASLGVVQRVTRAVGSTNYLVLAPIPHTNFELVRRDWHPRAPRMLFDTATNSLLGAQLTSAEAAQLLTVLNDLSAQHVTQLDAIVRGLDHAYALGIPPRVTLARLNLIHDTVRDVVSIRIQADHALIHGMFPPGTINPAFALAFQSLEISGSDPHKGGQVVAFINYHNLLAPGTTVRVVYKPGDLRFDRLLFGDQPGSVSRTLAAGLSSYHIMSLVDAAAPDERLQRYGYMQFVSSAAPATAAHVTSVYNSVGRNLAIAYVFGLRDIHRENFILLADRIQLIDMEAATGTFTGFGAMELMTLPNELSNRLANGFAGLDNVALTALLPAVAALQTAIRNGFTTQLAAMNPGAAPAALAGDIATASTTPARFVPFPTADLQALAALYLGRLAPPTAATLAQFQASTAALATQTAGATVALIPDLTTLLQSPATMTALDRGDVPFWTRRGNDVFAEDGGAALVANFQHPRLETSANIVAGANTRRGAPNAAAALAALNAQAIPLFGNSVVTTLARHRALRINAGHRHPPY